MSSLGPQTINSSYVGLLQVPGGVTNVLKEVQDGAGNPTGIQLSTTSVGINDLAFANASNISGGIAGNVPYQSSPNHTAFVPPGTAGQVFTSNGAGAPYWSTVSQNFTQGGTGAITYPITSKIGQTISVKDFGAVGDGVTNDTSAIQNAINYAASLANGSIVYFPAGVYSANKVIVKSNMILDGGGATLKSRSGQNYQIQYDTAATNVVIRNFIFDAANLTTVGGDSGAEAVVVYGSVAGIAGVGYFNITITGNRFKNIPTQAVDPSMYQRYHAILMTCTSGTFVSGNYVDQCGGDAINLNSSAGFAPPSSIVVTGNYVANCGDGGIAFNNGARGTISNNYLYKCDLGVGAGPVGSVGSTDNQSIIISGNTFDSCQYGVNFGFFLAGGIAPTSWSITSNVFKSCKQGALTYNGHTTSWEANGIFANNVVTDTGSNKYDGSTATTAIDVNLTNCGHTIVTGNILKNNVAATSAGIQLVDCNNCLVNGNSVESGALSYDNSIIVTNAFLTKIDNNIFNVPVVGILINGSGIGNDIEVTNNRFNDFTSYAVNLLNFSAGTTIKNNYLSTSSNPGTAINLSGFIQNVVCDNNTVILAAGGNAIVVNTSSSSVAYDVSFNTVYGAPILDGGTTTNKRLIENW